MNKSICLLAFCISFMGYASIEASHNEAGFINMAPGVLDSFTASDIAGSDLELSWTPAIESTTIDAFILYQDNNVYGWFGGTETNTIISGLVPERTYMFRMVILDTSGSYSDFSDPLYITTTEEVISYCRASSFDDSFEHIDYVGIGEISNSSSADGGYFDYTSQVANLTIGSSNTIELSAGFANLTYEESFGVWIDFNQNNVFEESEHVVSGLALINEESTFFRFLIPNTAKLGTTRMRVAMQYEGSPVACNSDFAYGEIEDYTINIMATAAKSATSERRTKSPINEVEKKLSVTVFPNPSDQYIQVNVSDKNSANYMINDVSGKMIKSGALQSNTIGLEHLESGTYFISIFNGKEKATKQFIKK